MTNNTTGAAGYDISGFATFLSHPTQQLSLDLSSASVVEVIRAYESFRKRTAQNYTKQSLIYNIRKIEKAFHCALMPVQINDMFYSYWVQYLLNQGCVYSTIQNYCDQLRASLRWAMRHQCPVSDTFDQYTIPHYSKTKIALTPDQISHIYHYDISALNKDILPKRIGKAYLDRARDMFVLACNLGQRYSDMIRITAEHFDETGNVFTIIQQKTNAKAVVHISEMSIDPIVTHEILRKYNYCAPRTGSINNYNQAIHFLLSTIGGQFNKQISTENKVNGKIELTLTPMHRMVSSHTARRTFITNAILRGLPEIKVRKSSGHTDGRHFGTYCIID